MEMNWLGFFLGMLAGAALTYLAAVFAGVDKKAEDDREERWR